VIVLLLLAIPAVAVVARSYVLAPTAQPTKSQPIQFPHNIHVNTVGLDCTYCHRGATTTADATLPALQLCMGCHAVVPTTGKPELEKLVAAFADGTPINWNRVHQVPDHVHFVHSMHINAGFDCATCHGDVGSMAKPGVKQVRDLRMGDCVTCHRENNARTDCATCHY
jgi:predicted CXXCH cytochrome family protein